MSIEYDIKQSYSASQFNDIIKKGTTDFKLSFTLFDVILLLLYSDKEHPIYGKTRYMKEIFLALKEIFSETDVQQIPFFKKDRYGPYSKEVINVLDDMLFSNYVNLIGKKNTNKMGIKLTPKGNDFAKEKFYELPDELQNKLMRKRVEWDTLTTQGIMNYVYTNYEDFLENAIMKKRFNTVNWDDKNEVDRKSYSKASG